MPSVSSRGLGTAPWTLPNIIFRNGIKITILQQNSYARDQDCVCPPACAVKFIIVRHIQFSVHQSSQLHIKVVKKLHFITI